MSEMDAGALVYQCGHSESLVPYSRHFHMMYEIIFVANGVISLKVGGHHYTVEKNRLVFLSNLEEHVIKILSAGYERYFFILSPSRLEMLILDPTLLSLFKMRPEQFSHVFDAPPHTAQIMKEMLFEAQQPDCYSVDLIAAYCRELLVRLYISFILDLKPALSVIMTEHAKLHQTTYGYLKMEGMGNSMNILVIDGQGGGIGKQLVSAIKASCPEHTVTAVGTNSAASAAMRKAGADTAATGENAVIVGCRKADVIVGPVGIVIADSLCGEITPKMAVAVGQSNAKRILIPVNHCDNLIAGVADLSLNRLIQSLIEILRSL